MEINDRKRVSRKWTDIGASSLSPWKRYNFPIAVNETRRTRVENRVLTRGIDSEEKETDEKNVHPYTSLEFVGNCRAFIKYGRE